MAKKLGKGGLYTAKAQNGPFGQPGRAFTEKPMAKQPTKPAAGFGAKGVQKENHSTSGKMAKDSEHAIKHGWGSRRTFSPKG